MRNDYNKMKKAQLLQLIRAYEGALQNIQRLWTHEKCLHTCRWGTSTLEICTDVLATTGRSARKKDCPNPGCHCGACD